MSHSTFNFTLKVVFIVLVILAGLQRATAQNIETTTTVVNTTVGFKATTTDFSGSVVTYVVRDGYTLITNTITVDNTGRILASRQIVTDYTNGEIALFILNGIRKGWENEAKK